MIRSLFLTLFVAACGPRHYLDTPRHEPKPPEFASVLVSIEDEEGKPVNFGWQEVTYSNMRPGFRVCTNPIYVAPFKSEGAGYMQWTKICAASEFRHVAVDSRAVDGPLNNEIADELPRIVYPPDDNLTWFRLDASPRTHAIVFPPLLTTRERSYQVLNNKQTVEFKDNAVVRMVVRPLPVVKVEMLFPVPDEMYGRLVLRRGDVDIDLSQTGQVNLSPDDLGEYLLTWVPNEFVRLTDRCSIVRDASVPASFTDDALCSNGHGSGWKPECLCLSGETLSVSVVNGQVIKTKDVEASEDPLPHWFVRTKIDGKEAEVGDKVNLTGAASPTITITDDRLSGAPPNDDSLFAALAYEDAARKERIAKGIGVLTSEQIHTAVNANWEALFGCTYQARLARKGFFEGSMEVEVKVKPDGRVGAATVMSSPIEDSSFDQCVLQVFRAMQFPRPSDNGSVVFTQTLVFGNVSRAGLLVDSSR